MKPTVQQSSAHTDSLQVRKLEQQVEKLQMQLTTATAAADQQADVKRLEQTIEQLNKQNEELQHQLSIQVKHNATEVNNVTM